MYLDALNSLLISGEYPPLFSVDELDSLLQVIWQRDNNICHSRLIILKISVKPFKASSTLRRRNWKTELFSRFKPSVHTNPSRNPNLSKRSSNWRNLTTPALCFSLDGKHFENEAFWKRWRHDSHVISPTKFSSKTNPKWPVIVAFFSRFLRRSVNGKYLMRCSSGAVWKGP